MAFLAEIRRYPVFKNKGTPSAHAFFRNYLHSSEIVFDIPVGQGKILNIDESLTVIVLRREGKDFGFLILLI